MESVLEQLPEAMKQAHDRIIGGGLTDNDQKILSLYALSETKCQMVQPDGWVRDFSRGNAQEKIIHGTQGWKAEITSNSIIAHASCGWKLTFSNGKISEIQNPKGRILTYEYKNGRVDQIREGAKQSLKVNWDEITNQIKGYEYNDKKIDLVLDKRPKIQVIKGERLIGAVENALVSLKSSDQKNFQYDYGVDKKLNPSFTVKDKTDRMMTWDPETKLIQKDGEWTYQITPSELDWVNAKIERWNSKNQNEMWWVDQRKGFEKWTKVSGDSYEKTWFVSGILSGKMRFEKLNNHVYKYKYSEFGKLIEFYRDEKRITLKNESKL